MADTADKAGESRPPAEAEKERIRKVVAMMVAGTSLTVREQPYELIISNPDRPANGQVYVDYEGGHIAWRHVAWEYIGQLMGFESEETTGTVSGQEIAGLLMP